MEFPLPQPPHTHFNISYVISVTTGMMGVGGKIRCIFLSHSLPRSLQRVLIPYSYPLGCLLPLLFGLHVENANTF